MSFIPERNTDLGSFRTKFLGIYLHLEREVMGQTIKDTYSFTVLPLTNIY
jgi:hypothetical protein